MAFEFKKYFWEITLLPTWWPKKQSGNSGFSLPKEKPNANANTKISLNRKEKIFFLDMVGSLVEAGIPLVKSLQLLYFQSKEPAVKQACLYVKTQIERGNNLGTTSRELPRVFGSFDCAMFEMWEATGKMGYVFGKLTEKEEKMLEIERKVFGAMIYPIAIITVALLMMSGLLIFVIPRIEKIYQDANAVLPPLTQGVIAFSHFLQSYGIITLILLVFCGIGFKILLRQDKIRLVVDKCLTMLPIFGKLIQYRILVSFCNFLSLLLASGITIHRALEIVSSGLWNSYYSGHVRGIINDIRTGTHLSDAVGGVYLEKKMAGEPTDSNEMLINKERLDIFTVELSTSIKVGEQTGSLSQMLEKAGKRYEKEIDVRVKNLNALLEPIVIIIIGAGVWVIILAIMMPFFNMAKVVG
jgi:type IV pilus assembly protein PilC